MRSRIVSASRTFDVTGRASVPHASTIVARLSSAPKAVSARFATTKSTFFAEAKPVGAFVPQLDARRIGARLHAKLILQPARADANCGIDARPRVSIHHLAIRDQVSLPVPRIAACQEVNPSVIRLRRLDSTRHRGHQREADRHPL